MMTEIHKHCDKYIEELIQEILKIQEENDRLSQENTSYQLWMNRSINRVKELQR